MTGQWWSLVIDPFEIDSLPKPTSWCSDLPLVSSIEYKLRHNNSEAGLEYLALALKIRKERM
jgi:hypothetical protein